MIPYPKIITKYFLIKFTASTVPVSRFGLKLGKNRKSTGNEQEKYQKGTGKITGQYFGSTGTLIGFRKVP